MVYIRLSYNPWLMIIPPSCTYTLITYSYITIKIINIAPGVENMVINDLVVRFLNEINFIQVTTGFTSVFGVSGYQIQQ